MSNLKTTFLIMKSLVFFAVVFAIFAVALLVYTLFVSGGTLVYVSISAGLALSAFIIMLVAYSNRSVER